MNEDINTQFKDDLEVCEVISLSLDESTDRNDVARLTLIAKFHSVSKKSIIEEVWAVAPMYNTTKSKDILDCVIKNINNYHNVKNKIFSVATDGAAAMIGKHSGFIKLFETYLERPILSFHCVIHQESICAELSCKKLEDVMSTVTQIVNKIIARSSLSHRKFKLLLHEVDSEYGDLLLYNKVRWLSRGKVINRFVNLLPEIKEFLEEIGEKNSDLDNDFWVFNVMFLADITDHLNLLNTKLQGKNQTILQLYEHWTCFVEKIDILKRDIEYKDFLYFLNLKKFIESINSDISITDVLDFVLSMKKYFTERFSDLQKHSAMFKFILQPDNKDSYKIDKKYFTFLNIDNLELELIEFNNSEIWKLKFKDAREEIMKNENNYQNIVAKTWNEIPNRFCCMKKVAFALLSIFGTTYYCEQTFSIMKYIINPYRNRLTEENSEMCVKLKTSNYEPDIAKLASNIEPQGSH